MAEIKLELNKDGYGSFFIKEGEEKLAEMMVAHTGNTLTVFHTEVFSAESKGLGKLLLNAMVGYARQHQAKVNPLCPFVYAQFKRHPEMYSDIWIKEGP